MIIYFNNGTNPFVQQFEECGSKVVTPYNPKLKVKIIRKVEKYRFFNNIIYNRKEIVPKENEKIIVFDSNISSMFLEWLISEFPHNRIIFWYWNPVKTTLHPDKIPARIEKWSYSPEDCKVYQLKYNTTFYFDNINSIYKKSKNEDTKEIKKALFVGRDKGRLQELLNLKKYLENKGLDCEFHIVGNSNSKEYSYEKPLNYDQVLEKIIDSDILIDYYTDNKAGLSLRPMEAMCFEKKLITNNNTIVDYDFYYRENIFCEFSDTEQIDEFLNIPYVSLSKDIRNKYSFSQWLIRFGE